MATDRVEQKVPWGLSDGIWSSKCLAGDGRRGKSLPWEIQILFEKHRFFWDLRNKIWIWDLRNKTWGIWDLRICLQLFEEVGKLWKVDTERNTERRVGLKWKPMPVGLYWCDENGKGLAQNQPTSNQSFSAGSVFQSQFFLELLNGWALPSWTFGREWQGKAITFLLGLLSASI